MLSIKNLLARDGLKRSWGGDERRTCTRTEKRLSVRILPSPSATDAEWVVAETVAWSNRSLSRRLSTSSFRIFLLPTTPKSLYDSRPVPLAVCRGRRIVLAGKGVPIFTRSASISNVADIFLPS